MAVAAAVWRVGDFDDGKFALRLGARPSCLLLRRHLLDSILPLRVYARAGFGRFSFAFFPAPRRLALVPFLFQRLRRPALVPLFSACFEQMAAN